MVIGAIERQMIQQERNNVRAAYIQKAEHLEARKAMMHWWSDYLNECRENMFPLIFGAARKIIMLPNPVMNP